MCHHWGCCVCVRGRTSNSSCCWSCFKGSTTQVRCWHSDLDSSVCFLHHKKLPVSRLAGKHKQKGVCAGFTAPQAVSPSLLSSKNCRRWAGTRRCWRGRAGVSCRAVRRRWAPGGARRCNPGQQESTGAHDPHSLSPTTFNTSGDKISPSSHLWYHCYWNCL